MALLFCRGGGIISSMTLRSPKVWIWVSVGVIFLLAFSYYGNHLQEIDKYFADRRDAKYMEEYNKNLAETKALYQADTDGGATPEETLDLFMAKLKANDVTGASKYYELSVQQKALTSLQEEIKKYGNLQLSINFFTEVKEKGKKTCVDIESPIGGCTFEYVYITDKDETVEFKNSKDKLFIPAGGVRTKIIDLWLNKYTKIWKIERPY